MLKTILLADVIWTAAMFIVTGGAAFALNRWRRKIEVRRIEFCEHCWRCHGYIGGTGRCALGGFCDACRPEVHAK